MAQKFNKLSYLQLLRHANLTHAQYRVLVTLLGYANPDGTNAHPGFAKLAKECRMSKGTVSKSVAYLKKAGWLWETFHGRPAGMKASVFELRVPPSLRERFPESTTRSVHTINDVDGRKTSIIEKKRSPWVRQA